MSNAFEYGDALLPESASGESSDSDGTPPQVESNQPYLNLATCVPFRNRKVDTLTVSLCDIFSLGLEWSY